MQILHLYYGARLVSKKIAKVVTKQMDDNVQNAIALFKIAFLEVSSSVVACAKSKSFKQLKVETKAVKVQPFIR